MPRHLTFAERADATARARTSRGPRLLVASVAVLCALAWGRVNPTDSLVVHDLLDHPIALGALAYLLAVGGIVHLVADQVRRVAVGVLLAGVGATGFALAGLVASTQVSAEHTVTTVPDPGGTRHAVLDDDGREPMRTARVVVQDPAWGLGAHRYEAACASMRSGSPVVRTLTWSGTTLRLELADGTAHQVALDEDGAPHAPLSVGPACR